MIAWMWALGGAIGGGVIVGLVVAIRMAGARRIVQDDLASERTRAAMLDEQRCALVADVETARASAGEADERREAAERELATLAEQARNYRSRFEEQTLLLDEAQKKLGDTFTALGTKALRENNEQFLQLAQKTLETFVTRTRGEGEKRQQAIDELVKPIRQLLERQGTAVSEIEKRRESAYARLEEQIRHIGASHEKLGDATNRLATALRRPEQRGRWGEMQLRNAVELAGMTAHCDFHEQVQTDDETTRDRPDMTVRLPGNGVIVLDAKVALDAYLSALEKEADRDALLDLHADQVARHVKSLANRRYWEQFERTPKIVVMFMPVESALVAALERKPDLQAEAMRRHVLIATPTLLVALLRAVAYGWQQEAIAENAREISRIGHELHVRLGSFVDHLGKVGRNLGSATRAYNRAVGSFDRMVLSSARKLTALQAGPHDEVERPVEVDIEVRSISASALGDDAEKTATPEELTPMLIPEADEG